MPDIEPERSGESAPAVHAERKEPNWRSLDQMLEDLPPGIPILPPEDACDFSKYTNKPRTFATGEGWQHCADEKQAHISQLCQGYREEIDTLLVFAGLFSAVVTGFAIDSYKWLQDDSNDVMVDLLAHIALSLGSENSVPSVGNKTRSGLPRSVSTRINVYWFLSLALSLSTALVAILAKQWVREFESIAHFEPERVVGVQQLKLDGHKFWKVAPIILTLPLLLQLSLALFAVGILELLWNLQPAVAIAVSVPTILAALFYLITTLIPPFQYFRRSDRPLMPQCAYKSPQSLIALQACQLATSIWRSITTQILRRIGRPGHPTHDNNAYQEAYIWGGIHSWRRWDLGFWCSDRYLGRPTTPFLHYRGLREILNRNWGRSIRQSAWNCIWEDANSREQQEGTHIFPRSLSDQIKRLKCSILQVTKIPFPAVTSAPPRTCALLTLPIAMFMDEGFVSECLIHNLPSLDIETADEMFSSAKVMFSQGRQHIQDDLGPVVCHISHTVAGCWDSRTRLAAQFVLVDLTQMWIRSRSVPAISLSLNPLATLLSHVLDDICLDNSDLVQHPETARSLPRVQELAALVRAVCEFDGQHIKVTWPLPDTLGEAVRSCTRSPYHTAQSGDDRSNDERIPLIVELLRISVCGANGGSAVLSSPELGDERVAARVPQDGVASPSDAAQSTSTASHDRVSTLTDTRERRTASTTGAAIVASVEHVVSVAAPPGPPQGCPLAAARGEHPLRDPRGTGTPILDIVVVRRGNDRPELGRGAATPDIGPSAQPRGPQGQAAAVAGDVQHASDAVEPRAGQVETEGDAPLPSSSGALALARVHTAHDRRDFGISDGADIPRLEVVVVGHEHDGADRGPGPGEHALPGSGLQSPHSRWRIVGGSDAAGGDEEHRAGMVEGQGRNDAALVDSGRVRGATRDHSTGREIESAASGAGAEGDPTRAHRTGASPGTGIGQSTGQV